MTKTASIKQQDTAWHIDNKRTTRIDGVEGSITLDPVVGGTAAVTVTPPESGKMAVPGTCLSRACETCIQYFFFN